MAFNASTARYLSSIVEREIDKETELDSEICRDIDNAIMDGKTYMYRRSYFGTKGYAIKFAEKTEILLVELGYNIIDCSYIREVDHGIRHECVDVEISW